jgi:hypothetical protein
MWRNISVGPNLPKHVNQFTNRVTYKSMRDLRFSWRYSENLSSPRSLLRLLDVVNEDTIILLLAGYYLLNQNSGLPISHLGSTVRESVTGSPNTYSSHITASVSYVYWLFCIGMPTATGSPTALRWY